MRCVGAACAGHGTWSEAAPVVLPAPPAPLQRAELPLAASAKQLPEVGNGNEGGGEMARARKRGTKGAFLSLKSMD